MRPCRRVIDERSRGRDDQHTAKEAPLNTFLMKNRLRCVVLTRTAFTGFRLTPCESRAKAVKQYTFSLGVKIFIQYVCFFFCVKIDSRTLIDTDVDFDP